MVRALLVGTLIRACAGETSDRPETFGAPKDQSSRGAWLEKLEGWRSKIAKDINYTGGIYDDPDVNWTRTNYIQPQEHLFDRYLYDEQRHEYTVDRYLDSKEKLYGGIDSILIWPTYPNIGIDARNQFDLFRALPGGLTGVKKLTADFHRRGVKVLWPYNPWDQGLRDEGEPHWDTLARLVKENDGDGFNGDTMGLMYQQFWDAGLKIGHKLVGEMEGGGYWNENVTGRQKDWKSLNWNAMGWGYFSFNQLRQTAPGIDRIKWFDGRRMTHVCNRWSTDRHQDMQEAWFNGVGYESWENVWGVYVHFTPRDAEYLRRMATMLRWLGPQRFIQGYKAWDPYTPDLKRDDNKPYEEGGLLASRFLHESGDCAWLIINRAADKETAPATKGALDVSSCSHAKRFYDLYRGVELITPITVDLETDGFTAIIGTSRDLEELDLTPLLKEMAEMTKVPLAKLSNKWEPISQQMVEMPTTKAVEKAPKGMIKIPKETFDFRTAGVMIEGGCDPAEDEWGICCPNPLPYHCPGDAECATPCSFQQENNHLGVDVQFPWESTPVRFHKHRMSVGPFFMDEHLVTKADYHRYLQTSGYTPRDAYNFLVGWDKDESGALRPAEGEDNQPVVWVSLREARAYCQHQGKRLPHAYEWQLAAQGTDGRLYPWGNNLDPKRMPEFSNGNSVPSLPDVGSYSPQGDSLYGMKDIVGFVWQFTDEFQDNHTRGALLKGSSLFTPMLSSDFPADTQVGDWYFPKAQQLDRHNRLLLMDDTFERAGTLGFRCVADHADGHPGPHHYGDVPLESVEHWV